MAHLFHKESLPDNRLFFEWQVGSLTKANSKGWALGSCPFHRSKSGRSFSVNIRSGAFHCFGCDARGGDVVDFVKLRDRCDFKSACQSLGAWRGDITRDERRQLDEQAVRARHDRELQEQARANERARRLALRDEIHTTAAIYREANDRLAELGRGAAEAYEGEQEHCWTVLALALDDLRASEQEYMQFSGLGDAA